MPILASSAKKKKNITKTTFDFRIGSSTLLKNPQLCSLASFPALQIG